MAIFPKTFVFLSILTLNTLTDVISIKPFVLEEQLIWESKAEGDVSTYRIPLIIQVPTGDLLAFSEARKYSSADAGAKFIAMRRSTNGGNSWGPTSFILNDYKVPDGLNLGTVMIDHNNNTLILVHTFCVHSVCNTTGQKPSGVFTVTSTDWGYSWQEPINMAENNPLLAQLHWDPGPGYGIQKKYNPHKGRLITCGHLPAASERSMFCLYSDDGVTWHLNEGLFGLPYQQTKVAGDFVPGEVQLVELKNGTLLANIRNTYTYHCHCRIQVLSFDGGQTFPFSHMRLKEELVDPGVCGSILNFNDIIFFSHAYNPSSRVNMTLHWSLDSGASYKSMLNIYPKGSAYSCLSPIDENHIGLIFEKDGYKYISFVKIQLNL
ncbi:sialidase-1-like [Diadema setosum]|uniref:sialidase-1-like n=1 Tax=Diadema setosum TaxID=31175 RepID=UPI003B3BC560